MTEEQQFRAVLGFLGRFGAEVSGRIALDPDFDDRLRLLADGSFARDQKALDDHHSRHRRGPGGAKPIGGLSAAIIGRVAGVKSGRDRVPVRAAGLLSKPRTYCDHGRKYALRWWQILAARGDATPSRRWAALDALP